ncbi:hypothetical protein GRF61_15270 [Azoarcus sp. TTM-91]|uniref:hypothetical protein n=1 Tax=Azoarcus sp. TTM-91 TaxID=2691581 RepID=UPI00145DEDE2|nr:hypothetical protein [Azoarcus sp. TTM-91]NMG35807.1 hypothetical protein [Azoarcus sp. TTM-91]
MDAAMIFALLAAGMLVAVVLMLMRREQEEGMPVRHNPYKASYHAVCIQSGNQACDAARHVRGRRFLAAEAPRLPMPNCSRGECNCVYVHFDDRRVRNRRDVYANKSYMIGEQAPEERRRASGRRKTDLARFHPIH